MVQFAVPSSIIAMLVGAIYNIVDQFFIVASPSAFWATRPPTWPSPC